MELRIDLGGIVIMKFAVTGSTGHFGQYAVPFLRDAAAKDDTVVALARNVDKAKQLYPEGVEVQPGTYEDEDQLVESLNGVDRLLMISSQPGAKMPRVDQHRNVVNAAKKAGVKFIAYLSFPKADTSTVPLAADHQATEKIIKESGIAHAFLRNNWYIENEGTFLHEAKVGDPFVYAAKDGKVGWAPEKLYAQAAVKVLTSDKPKEVYEFAGPMHTYGDLADAMKKATGHDFEVASVSDDEYMANLRKYVPDQLDAFLSLMQKLIRDGALEETTSDLSDVLGKPLPSLDEAVADYLKENR
ncbi:NmrA family protein [Lentilactobacillus parafarraginis F0439]|uniref:NmrA family protein n=2 Tax=Lentilactobacillus parafarraginis TaxID=390842 RepID=G9ZNL3_9LACO|nr:NmrA family protein [Lentilactobacillus parafarraginis F0439]